MIGWIIIGAAVVTFLAAALAAMLPDDPRPSARYDI
jgi:hypothetical protein